MNLNLSILKPTVLSGILLVLILLVQGVFFTSGSTTYALFGDGSAKTEISCGVGRPLTVTARDGVTDYDIRWPVLLVNLAACYLLAAYLAVVFSRATCFRRPGLVYGVVALAMVVLSLAVSISISRLYWGYFFARPPVLREVNDVASVTAVIPIETETGEDGARRIVARADYSIADRLAYGRKERYYCLDERLLLALEEMKLLPPAHAADLRTLPALFPLVRRTGLLAEPEEGYDDSDLLSGVVIDAVGKSNRRLVFLAATGRQLSNDHYPYYEMLFTGAAGSPDLSYARGQRFFYDVAGIEGAEWYLFWPLLALVGVMLGFITVTAFMLVRRLVGRMNKVRRDGGPAGLEDVQPPSS